MNRQRADELINELLRIEHERAMRRLDLVAERNRAVRIVSAAVIALLTVLTVGLILR
jgi:hypothetical protein